MCRINIAVNLRPGIGFIVTSEADPATRVKGQVREIAPQADLATRTRRVRITLVDPPLSFRLGTIVKAVAGMDAGAEIELPSSALLERDGKTFVWVVDAATRKVSMREVKIGARDADSFRVAEGLAAGTRVVTAGVHSLLPDQVVKIAGHSPMKTNFNLSEWALRHRSLVWYFMGIFAVMGVAVIPEPRARRRSVVHDQDDADPDAMAGRLRGRDVEASHGAD